MIGFQSTANHLAIAGPLITAIAGIGGVLVGGLITFYIQLTDRRLARIREKLDQFYAPMVALRSEIKAKSETRLKLHGIAQRTWEEQLGYLTNPSDKAEFTKERWPSYEKIFRYSEEQLKTELIPLYRKIGCLHVQDAVRRKQHEETLRKSCRVCRAMEPSVIHAASG
jgi:hypothetical protein